MTLFKAGAWAFLLLVALAQQVPAAAEAKKKSSRAEVSAGDGAALMKKSDCFTCHSVKNKIVGPAYIEVAKKYKGDKGAVARLVKKVKEGGTGVWGQVPMAAHPDLKDGDLRAMLQWVLKQK